MEQHEYFRGDDNIDFSETSHNVGQGILNTIMLMCLLFFWKLKRQIRCRIKLYYHEILISHYIAAYAYMCSMPMRVIFMNHIYCYFSGH